MKITKLGLPDCEPTIGEIATKDYRKAELFWRFGIDYCCGGKKTLKQACGEAGIREEILEEIYLESTKHKDREIYDFEAWEVDFLIDYIVNTHHTYVKHNSERLNRLAFKVTSRHGHTNPELKELTKRLKYFLSDLNDHMKKEEQDIFPSLKKLVANKKRNKGKISINIEANQAVRAMEEEHKSTGEDLKFFRKITNNYKLPKDACISYTHLFAKLLEFENDLVQHIHLENNILFPKAMALEKELEKNNIIYDFKSM